MAKDGSIKNAVGGYKLMLKGSDGQVIDTRATDQHGVATFFSLKPAKDDSYVVEFQIPEVKTLFGSSFAHFKLSGPSTITCQFNTHKGILCDDTFVIEKSLVFGKIEPPG